uniref:Uncharacterized protein n=1 Tax=Nelumbo nucifera TaxID=4432 RepID=A0A822XUU5_NELNU|nr:TPA_asm: hypothetical protein HUJ06_026858 [Nelumbo nucifera]
MDFMISSKNHLAFSQSEKINYFGDRQDPETKDPFTTCLYLKPSNTSEALDKDDVLQMDDFLREERCLEDAFSAP